MRLPRSSDETLRNHLRARIVQIEEVTPLAIARDLGLPQDDYRVQLVAACFTRR